MTENSDVLLGQGIGERMLRLRKRLGLTQQEAADRGGTARVQWNSWERGAGLSLDSLCKVCQALGVSADELLGLNEPPPCSGCATREETINNCRERLRNILGDLPRK